MKPSQTFFALAAAVIVTGCHQMTTDSVRFHVRGASYFFPERAVSAISTEPISTYGPFIRLNLDDIGAIIEYDDRSYLTKPEDGVQSIIPHITTATDPSNLKTSVVNGTQIFCIQPDIGLHFQCGTQIENHGVRWSIRFDHSKTPDAPSIVKSVDLFLNKHYLER